LTRVSHSLGSALHLVSNGAWNIMDLTDISITETDGQIFLRCLPSRARAPVDAAMLHTLLEQAGFGQCVWFEDAIVAAAASCNTQQTPVVAHIAQRSDACVQVQIAADEMAAQVHLTAPHGGKAVTLEDIQQALQEAGVVFGIDEAALIHACDFGQTQDVAVACGVAPQDGRDTAFETLLAQTANRAPQLDENGLIDYREHGAIMVVHPGEPLMRRIPPTPGVTGHTVRGRELVPRAGIDAPFAATLSGARLAPDDPNLLQAAAVGQPVLVNHGVMVEPVLRVAEVNIATGNIHFDGAVQVEGEVTHGMRVQASGDIVVGGTVDGGLLEAGGDIRIAGGIIANSKVHAQGAVSARFAEGSTIRAGTIISVDDMALSCDLESLNQILVGDKVPKRGRLVGGSATAMMLIRVPLLGSNKSGTTRIRLAVNTRLDAQMKELAVRLAQEKTTEENLQKLVKHLEATGDPKGMLERVKASWRQAVQVWSRSLAEQRALEEQMALAAKARLELGLGVGGAVDLSFGSQHARLRTEFDQGVFSMDPVAGMVFTNPAGKVVVIMKP
jgi:adhesin HecA-like repeat protein